MLNDKKIPECLFLTIPNLRFLFSFFLFFFAKQCSIIENNSALPSSANPITDQYLGNFEFMKDDINRIICKLDPNNVISIRMLKMSGDVIIEPLQNIQKMPRNIQIIYSNYWKKVNIVQIFKKSDKQNIKNYCPLSLLPICSKNTS